MYRGLIAAAGLSTRLQDHNDKRNKVLADLGGESILSSILSSFECSGIGDVIVLTGHDAHAVRLASAGRARCVLNPFFEQYGILSSVWLARPHLDGTAFVFTTGDHYFALPRFAAFLADQPAADVLVDVELKACDDEDMKVFLNRSGKLRTMSKTFLQGPVLGEFTGAVRFSADGSAQLFETLEKHVWERRRPGLSGRRALRYAPQMGTGVSPQQRPPPYRSRFPLRPHPCPSTLRRASSRVPAYSLIPPEFGD